MITTKFTCDICGKEITEGMYTFKLDYMPVSNSVYIANYPKMYTICETCHHHRSPSKVLGMAIIKSRGEDDDPCN